MFNFNEVHKYSKDLRILYVEDDKNLMEETFELLEDFFYETITAVNGEDGLSKYIKFKENNNSYYDLIITDINMPKMDGITMIKHIMEINPEQSVIVISAYNDSDKLIELIHQGISNFILKPMNSENLMNILYKTCKAISNQKAKDSYLIQQSKMASMGEMIDFIAHQWLQPIHIIKMQTDLFEMNNNKNKLTKECINDYIETQISQVNHLVNTLQEFRKFFRVDTDLSIVSCKKLIEKTLLLLRGKIKNKIDVFVYIPDNITINVIINEFKHVIINIINNALEAFEENNIENKTIIFNLDETSDHIKLNIIDNAGGVPKSVINNIFNSYFTTKKEGTGVGLYLSTLIIDKIGGKLDVENVDKGAKFSIILPKI